MFRRWLMAAAALACTFVLAVPAARAAQPCWAAPDGRAGADADRRWEAGSNLAVLFLDGTPEERARVTEVAGAWSGYAHLGFVFFEPGGRAPADSHVRVSFACPKIDAAIGTDALAIPPAAATVCLPPLAGGGEDEFDRRVLHAFGHVLGLRHEDVAAHLGEGSILADPLPDSGALSWSDREAAAILYPGHAPVAMTVGVVDDCVDGEPARYRYFDLSRGGQWPGGGDSHVTDTPGVPQLSTLACAPGTRICHGAAAGERSWGLGLDRERTCRDCCYFCAPGVVDPWRLDCPVPVSETPARKVALKASNGKYVMAAIASGQDGSLLAISPRVKPWERYTLETLASGQVALKAANGLYVEVGSDDAGGAPLRAVAEAPTAAAAFTLVEMGEGQVALQALDGRYVSARGEGREVALTATAVDIQPTEILELTFLD